MVLKDQCSIIMQDLKLNSQVRTMLKVRTQYPNDFCEPWETEKKYSCVSFVVFMVTNIQKFFTRGIIPTFFTYYDQQLNILNRFFVGRHLYVFPLLLTEWI